MSFSGLDGDETVFGHGGAVAAYWKLEFTKNFPGISGTDTQDKTRP